MTLAEQAKKQEMELAATRGAARIVEAVNKLKSELGESGERAFQMALIELGARKRTRSTAAPEQE
jgi:hypothetical protein